MRHVRCIPDGTKVPRTGHIDMRTSGLAPEAACVPQTAQDRLLVGSQLLTAVAGLILVWRLGKAIAPIAGASLAESSAT
jgi:hypothetical protein